MTDTAPDTDPGAEDAPKKGKKGLVVVLLLALVAGGGAFGAVWTGMLDGLLGGAPAEAEHADAGGPGEDAEAPAPPPAGAPYAFHEIDPIAVSIGTGGEGRQLRIRIVLELGEEGEDAVAGLEPRLQDAMLGYLRALDPAVLDDPATLLALRAQMLRRARLIAGEEAVANLLVTDFVLN
ncbi:flagellar basal body-associated protein FliL [Jannaschia sp. W003]|uniref:flagellar basal body-associated FliL family protein n=1 Tax=Jannaschia sp. W003 TaxID=2867012 RepID=UPI0021A7B036|nr:flagellar basal body-associated FliL family protein [Jannaschia sp. W003]UWQ21822.1 flagellar basal body-associated FliL family protein [Jannaschia sp. W003]